jgi:MscS family membrane protein
VFTPLVHFSLLLAQLSPIPAVPARPAGMQDPLNRDTPQSSVLAFLEACRVQNYGRATLYMDLRKVQAGRRAATGERLAVQLEEILDRDARFDVGALSRDPRGDLSDGLDEDRETIATLLIGGQPNTIDLIRVALPSGLEVWQFSSATLDLIPKMARVETASPVEKYLPRPLVEVELLNTPLWRWIGLALLALALFALSGIVSRAALGLLHALLGLAGSGISTKSLEIFVAPARLLVSLLLFRAGMEAIGPSALLRLALTRLLSLLFVFGLVWICTGLVDLCMVRTRTWVDRRGGRSSFAAFQLGSRVLKVIIVLAAVTALMGSWGYNTGTIWAGLGVGGLAVALAAQKTLENLFGGVSVITDRPVAIGDFCRFENRTGTVEDIGLRSTRLRTPEQTLVTVPNGQFSAMTLENFSHRDKILFKTTLNLKRDATPEQLRKLIDDITQTLQGDTRIDAGNVPARMIGIGQWSFDVEVFVLIRTADANQFLSIQQELLLKLLALVRENGMSLALPTQVSVSAAATPAPGQSGAVAPS